MGSAPLEKMKTHPPLTINQPRSLRMTTEPLVCQLVAEELNFGLLPHYVLEMPAANDALFALCDSLLVRVLFAFL